MLKNSISTSLKSRKRAFTVVEMMIVIALFITLGATALELVASIQRNTVEEETITIVSALIRTRHQAVTNQHERSYGVRFLSDSYVIFSQDDQKNIISNEKNSLDTFVKVTGQTEFVFEELTGNATAGTLTVQSMDEKSITKTITVLPDGVITW